MLFALDCFDQNINGNIFYDWRKFALIPSIKTKCVIMMDNAHFHNKKCIKKLLNNNGYRKPWLPLYSSDMNLIGKK